MASIIRLDVFNLRTLWLDGNSNLGVIFCQGPISQFSDEIFWSFVAIFISRGARGLGVKSKSVTDQVDFDRQINWPLLGGLRFALAMIVVFRHLQWLDNNAVTSGVSALGSKAAVVSFLMVSGFSIAASFSTRPDGFYKRRFVRIYPIYFFSLLWAVALELWLDRFNMPGVTIVPTGMIAALGNFFLLQTFLVKTISFNGPLWSLAVEASYYVVTPIIRRMPAKLLLTCAAVSIAFYLMPMRHDLGDLYNYALKANAVKWFWPFALGFTLFFYRSLAFVIPAAALGALIVQVSDLNDGPLSALTFATSALIIYVASTKVTPKIRWLDYLGEISYPLYIVQFPTIITLYALTGTTSISIACSAIVGMSILAFELIDVRLKRKIFPERGSTVSRTTPQVAAGG